MATKKSRIIGIVANKIAPQYFGMKLTLRQVHYRLVEHCKNTDINYPNTTSQYKTLSKYLVEARKDGLIPYSLLEDKDRDVKVVDPVKYRDVNHIWDWVTTDVKQIIKDQVEYIRNKATYLTLDRMLYQEDVVVVMLEKKALENLFEPICRRNNAYLVVCKGYNSLTQLKELANTLAKEERRIHLKAFSDFDPSGLDIQRNFIEQMQELGIEFESIERVALTQQQIDDLNLPYAPVKPKDARANNWTASGVVELDAVEPQMLQDLCEKTIEKHFNKATYHEVKRLQKALRKKLTREADKLIKEIYDQIVH